MKTQTEKAEEHSIDAWLDPEIKPEDPIGLPTFRIVYEAGFITGHTEGRREALEMAQGLVDALRTACEELNLAEGRFEEDIAPRAVHLYKEQAREGVEELRLALTRFEAWRDGK